MYHEPKFPEFGHVGIPRTLASSAQSGRQSCRRFTRAGSLRPGACASRTSYNTGGPLSAVQVFNTPRSGGSPMTTQPNRRRFLQTGISAGLTLALADWVLAAQEESPGWRSHAAAGQDRPAGVDRGPGRLPHRHGRRRRDGDLDHARGIDEGMTLLRQRLGLPRRPQRGVHGQGPRDGRPPAKGVPHDQGLRPRLRRAPSRTSKTACGG